jgi:hypothetical protein
MMKIMKVLLKCSNMATECANILNEGITHLVYSTNVIHSWWMGILCATWHKMIPKPTNPRIKGQN